MSNVPVFGADPEFLFIRNNKIVPAHEIVADGECGFGCDGHPATGEVRPGYSSNILEVLAKIERCIKMGDLKLKIGDKVDRMVAGHYKHNEPLGGHIHIAQEGIGGSRIWQPIAKALDLYLENCLEDILSDPDERRQRTNRGYGRTFEEDRGAVRTKGPHRIEYRSPGSWIVSPNLSYAYLYVAKAIMVVWKKGMRLPAVETYDQKLDALLDLVSRVKKITRSKDMEIGAEVLKEVLNERVDWNADMREEWIG